MVMTELEKLVALCQQLQMGAKTPVQGKTATFQKVLILRLCVLLCIFFVCVCTIVQNESVTCFCPVIGHIK